MKGRITGLIGFIGFVTQFLVVAHGERIGLSQDIIVSIAPWLVFVWIIMLWIGIVKTIKSKGENLLLGFFLCLIAPLGWLIALFLKDKRVSSEISGAVSDRKFFWASISMLVIGLALLISAKPKAPSAEIIEGLRATHRLLVEKGALINTKRDFTSDDFISLTGLDIGARLRAEGSAKMNNHEYGCMSLSNTDIADEDLALLKVFANLRQLDLSDTGITDAGIIHLAELKKLERLSLKDSKVTGAGRERLKDSLPHCDIY